MSGDGDRLRPGGGPGDGPGGGSGGGPLDLLLALPGRLLCLLGVHDFVLVSRTFGFGPSGNVEKVECRRCGYVTARKG